MEWEQFINASPCSFKLNYSNKTVRKYKSLLPSVVVRHLFKSVDSVKCVNPTQNIGDCFIGEFYIKMYSLHTLHTRL